MLPSAQGLRWSQSTACRGKARLLATHSARNFSSLPSTSARATLYRSHARKSAAFLSPQQIRSISWTGWWSSKPDSPPVAPPSEPSTETSAQHILDDKGPVRASYTTGDTPSPLAHTDQAKPNLLEQIEDTVLAPPEGAAEATDISQIPERIGYLTEVCGLEYWYGPTATLQWVMEHIHVWGSIPWSVTIITTGVIIRLLPARFTITAQRMGVKVREMQPHLQPLKEEYRLASTKGNRQEMMRVGTQMRQLHKEAGIKMLDGFKPLLFQIPLTFGGFRTLRNATELPVPSMESESFLWLDSLVVGDPWIIPIIIGAMTYRTMSKSAAQMAQTGAGPQAGVMLAFRYVLPFGSIIFCHYQALAAQLWFFTMTLFSQFQVSLLNNQKFRNYFDLGPVPGPQAPLPPTDAFGYRMDTQVGGMHVRNRDIVDVEAKSKVEEVAPPPQKNVSAIDKAVDSAKATWSSQTKDVREWVKKNRVEKQDSNAQQKLDDYERHAHLEQNRRREQFQSRSRKAPDDGAKQVGNMSVRHRK